MKYIRAKTSELDFTTRTRETGWINGFNSTKGAEWRDAAQM
jgi:hypothetical protein